MTQRSTKGASKQRRDAINDRISQIRELLPVSEAVRGRMSQLQVMAFTNAFIAKSNFFTDYCFDVDDHSTMLTDVFDFTQTLPGFLLMASVDGRILYISDNVSDYLGNSSVDTVTQLESVYDLIDERDREILREAMTLHQKSLSSSTSSTVGSEPWMQAVHGSAAEPVDCAVNELSFTCRMNSTARGVRTVAAQSTLRTSFERQKTMQVTGKFLRPRSVCFGARSSYSNPHLMTVFVAHCTPHLAVGSSPIVSCIDVTETSEADTMTFRSVHQLDMSFVKIDANGEFHLSCDRRTIFGKSWYAMIHPEDIEEAKNKHTELTTAYHIGDMSASRSLCLRVQTANGRNLWLHTVMRLQAGGNFENSFGDFSSRQAMIMCTSNVIDEMSALFIRLQELETPTEIAEGDGHQMIAPGICGRDDGIFNGVPLGLFEPTQPLKPTSMPTTSQREEDRLLVNQRLKRKICDRQLEQQYTDAVLPSKVSRMDNMLSMELSDPLMPLCSMPSPPMQPWDCNATQSTTGSVGQAASAFNYSTFGVNEMQDFSMPATTFNFRTNDDVRIPTRNFAPVPDSYVTPSNSPVTMDNSSTEDVNLFGLDDLIKSHTDDHSFFGNSQPVQNVIQQKASLVTSHPNSGRWNVASLPELDLCSVASILGDSELPTPTSAVAPTISEFGLKVDACRQQLSGGHVIIVNGSDQSVIFGRPEAMSAPANQPQQVHLMTAAATMTRSEPQNCSGNGTAVDQPFDQQLICNLLALGDDFIQNVTLNMSDPSFTPYGADVFQSATVNQFPCLATSVFD